MDDLNDLVWTQPSGGSGQKNGLAAGAGRTSSPFASSFDMLAGTSSASSINRSYNSSPMPRSLTPSTAAQAPPNPTRSPVNGGSGGGDAFAGLLSLGGGSSSLAAPTGLSLAQRQAKLAVEQLEQKKAEAKAFHASGSFWDSFEGGSTLKPAAAMPTPSLAPAARTSSPLLTPSGRPTTPAAASLLKPAPRPSAPSANVPPANLDPWDEFDLLASRAAPVASSSRSQAAAPAAARPLTDPFDLFEQAAPKPPSVSSAPRTISPRDHEFGDRPGTGDDVRGLMAGGDGSDDDDDFMGAFNRPKPQQSSRLAAQPKASARITRPKSPPIHLIGQLVEMGFSPSAAKEALASTESGEDVETAAAMLLSAGGGSRSAGAAAAGSASDDDDDEQQQERERQRKEEEEVERRRRRRQGPSRSAVAPDRAPSPANRPETPSGDLVAPLQDLLATTNLIGQSVFNRANAFWSSSKQQVQKAYEERQKANGSPAPGMPRDGRPKWMVDAEAADAGEWQKPPAARQEGAGSGGGFRDGDDEEEAERPRPQVNAQASSSRRPPAVQQQAAPSLIEPEATRSYTSSRRHPPKPTSSPGPTPRAPARQPSPAAAPLKQRKLVPAPPQILDAAAGYRTKGNAAFKLGQFAEAEAAYSTAIDILPDGHLRLVPLLNNRAAAHLKNGDHSASVADSSRVVALVGLDFDPVKEAPLPVELGDIALGDALVKAVSKRAAALEMGERWAQAQADWELVSSLAVCQGASKTAALDGARRCKKMVDVLTGKSAPAAPARRAATPSRPVARPRPKAAPVEGGASARLKEANAALESEDAERSELKDSVDGRVAAWKTGKEANLRALIASLDGVLWPELGWQKVGLHELVTDKQVKIRYTRAIGKLHPDKLAIGQTTVEQRMIAGAVFGTLNEAWNASQK